MTQRRQSPTPKMSARIFSSFRRWHARAATAAAIPILILVAGCGGGASSSTTSSGGLSVTPGTAAIDTNCTGCNMTTNGGAVEQFSSTVSGSAATVTWSVSGGDPNSGAGTISNNGQYTPPNYLTADSVQVTVKATLTSNSSTKATATLTITPGFLQPLSPENVALGSGATAVVTGYIAEAGGSTSVNYNLSGTATGSSGGEGSLGNTSCVRNANAFTYCTVTYTAPSPVSSTGTTFVVATVGTSPSKVASVVLLNTAGITSNPSTHQTLQSTPILLGSSGGNNKDYDTQGNQISDCCGGTLGALIQNSGGTQYLLSCNHVLARSDQASAGEMIVQPGLIDNNCTPNGVGSGTTPVAALTAWLPLSSSSTNADAAIAQVNFGAVNPTGAIQEFGLPQANGTLAAAPPGVSSTGGKGENPSINLLVAKSGRTTGLTCANISAINLNVEVSYFKDCAETSPYLTKNYTNQIAIEGDQFSDAGDSGSLIVDSSNAEPVGLFFAGGVTNSGVSEGVANPVSAVLSELNTQQGTTYTFVGTTDHSVSCLSYGNVTAVAAQARTLTDAQAQLAEQAVSQARMLVNPSAGILGVATGKSSDNAGEAAVIVYVDQGMSVTMPHTIEGVRTQVIPTTMRDVSQGTAPASLAEVASMPALESNILNNAIAIKQQLAHSLLAHNPAFFGVGVGQSLDSPKEASLVVYVDRRELPESLPATMNGLRVRYVIMDRMHVTRSYLNGPVRAQSHCMSHATSRQSSILDLIRPHSLPIGNLY